MKSLDCKDVSILENENVAYIEAAHMNRRKANVCKHVVDGVLPRVVCVRGMTSFDVTVKGDVFSDETLHFDCFPAVFVCADCLVEFLADNAGTGAGTVVPGNLEELRRGM